ncbi:MAG: anthranilate phosphoribosyltransferase [Alphaproteobacteria bacterium]|nr:anthranilate phosphoribosyltransferase [Alphaproteobacteria bacterium]
MSEAMKPLIARIADGDPLSETQARDAFSLLMEGEATPAQIGAFLMGLRMRGETVDEITGGARIMREKAQTITAPQGAIDTAGTGGDGAGTFNISTAAAVVAAACGVPVAKHGNRALSSKSGSSEVLAALGVNIDAPIETVQSCLDQAGICFLMAPKHHTAMRHVGPSRAEMGIRTIFNLLGPLSNPAGTKRQLIGVFDGKWCEPLAQVLQNLGAEKVWIVHGDDGLDELTTTTTTRVSELSGGQINSFTVSPDALGLKPADPLDLRGGAPDENAAALRALLAGEQGAYRDIVVLNAGAALVVADRAQSLEDGLAQADEAISTGAARDKLAQLVELSNAQ